MSTWGKGAKRAGKAQLLGDGGLLCNVELPLGNVGSTPSMVCAARQASVPTQHLFSPKDNVRWIITRAASRGLASRVSPTGIFNKIRTQNERYRQALEEIKQYQTSLLPVPWESGKNKGISEKRNFLGSPKPICSPENYTVGQLIKVPVKSNSSPIMSFLSHYYLRRKVLFN